MAGVQKRRGKTPTLFDEEANREVAGAGKGVGEDGDVDEELAAALDDDNWIMDDLGVGMDDDAEEKRWSAKDGVKEMGESVGWFVWVLARLSADSECYEGAACVPTGVNAHGKQETVPRWVLHLRAALRVRLTTSPMQRITWSG